MKRLILIDPDKTWQGFIEYSKEKNIECYIIASKLYFDAFNDFYKFAADCIVADTNNINALRKSLKIVKSRCRSIHVFPSRDQILREIAIACQKESVKFASHKSICTCIDKYLMRNKLRNISILQPRFWEMKDIFSTPMNINFPVVIKPKSGYGSLFTAKVSNKKDFDNKIGEFSLRINHIKSFDYQAIASGFIIEEWVDGPIYSIELGLNGEKTTVFMISIATTFQENECVGAGTIMPFCPDPDIENEIILTAKKACNSIGLSYGIANIELKLLKGKACLIEINARKMGGEMSRIFGKVSRFSFAQAVLDFFYDGRTYDWKQTKGYSSTHKIMNKVDLVSAKTKQALIESTGSCETIEYGCFKKDVIPKNSLIGRFIAIGNSPEECFFIGEKNRASLNNAIDGVLYSPDLTLFPFMA